MPYTQMQTVINAGAPPGICNYWKSSFLKGLDDAAIDTMVAHFASARSARSSVFVEHLGGAAGRVRPDATAFAHRSGDFNFSVLAKWTDPRDGEPNVRWARAFWSAMQPFATEAVYVNYLEPGQEGQERTSGAYGLNYERLVALKNRYDPTNFFRCNQNIRPTSKVHSGE